LVVQHACTCAKQVGQLLIGKGDTGGADTSNSSSSKTGAGSKTGAPAPAASAATAAGCIVLSWQFSEAASATWRRTTCVVGLHGEDVLADMCGHTLSLGRSKHWVTPGRCNLVCTAGRLCAYARILWSTKYYRQLGAALSVCTAVCMCLGPGVRVVNQPHMGLPEGSFGRQWIDRQDCYVATCGVGCGGIVRHSCVTQFHEAGWQAWASPAELLGLPVAAFAS
jgi:hypothetical protein